MITAVGAALRFWRLDQQSPWLDEVGTAYRVTGSFNELLQTLSNQGFGPLWFALLWLWARLIEILTGNGALAFSPGMLRILPAAAGTAMIPAMYLAARFFAPLSTPRRALLVAMFIAINPYSIYYSRDLKMYGLLWTLLTLHVGLLLAFHSRRSAWLYSLATLSLTLAAFTQGVAWLIAPLGITIALTRPRARWFDLPLQLLMFAIAGVAPLLWMQFGTHFYQDFVVRPDTGGLNWIAVNWSINAVTLCNTPAVYLVGSCIAQWPVPPETTRYFLLGADFSFSGPIAIACGVALTLFLLPLLTGLLPERMLPRQRRLANPDQRMVSLASYGRRWWLYVWAIVPLALVALVSLPRENPLSLWPHYMVYQHRYVAAAFPAFVMWFALGLINLPNFKWFPIRTVMIVIAASVCLASSLSNHLTYRLPPYLHMAKLAKPYWDKQHPESMMMIHSRATSCVASDLYAYATEFGYRPHIISRRSSDNVDPEIPLIRPYQVSDNLNEWARILHSVRYRNNLTTVVVSDRLADTNQLSDEMVQQQMGPEWQEVLEDHYRLRYEWNLHLSHHYRTRIYKKVIQTQR